VNASVAAWASPPAPPIEWKPVEPIVDDGWNDLDCSKFWQWRNNPAEWPDPNFPCRGYDWTDSDPDVNAFVVTCQRPVAGGSPATVQYYAAQCDRFYRTSRDWTKLESASRLKHKFSSSPTGGTGLEAFDCLGCPSIALEDQPMVSARDELLIRFVPMANAKPIRVSLRAQTRVTATGLLEVTNCVQSSANVALHAKADFKPGIWSAEVLEEMQKRNMGVVSVDSNQSLQSPGHLVPVSGGVTVGGGPGGVQFGWQWGTAIPPALNVATLYVPVDMSFYAKWCVSPPAGDDPALDFVASVDLESDTHVMQNASWHVQAVTNAETLALKFARDPFPGEDPCSTCTGGQSAVGPSGFNGGGTGG
jgi:hypothetical protein